MKILAIRGENLASLAKPFDLNFAAEPLAGAGLFAITGPTGSGKSTLLDALCLALYAEYPRLDASGSDKIFDASGDQLAASAPTNILTRGASDGFAEVDFEDHNGIQHRARWEVRRSYAKADGKLQKEQRSLTRLQDNVVLADKSKDVAHHIADLTGLSFEQFRRTCLLAQGQFDAFLLAGVNERSALLEKITGTDLYSRISELIFTGARQHRDKVDLLAQQQSTIPVLSTEKLASLEFAITLAQQSAARHTATINLCDTQRNHLLNRDAATTRHTQAIRLHNNALLALSNAAPQKELLQQLHRVEPLRALATSVDQARALEDQATRAATSAEHDLPIKRSDLEQATTIHNAKTLSKARIDQQVEQSKPLWSRAEALDSQIELATTQLTSTANSLALNHSAVVEAKTHAQQLDQQFATATLKHASLDQQLREQSARALPASQITVVETLLRERIEFSLPASSSLPTSLEVLEAKIADCNQSLLSIPVTQLQSEQRSLQSTAQILNQAVLLATSYAQDSPTAATLPTVEASLHSLQESISSTQNTLAQINRSAQTLDEAADHLRSQLSPGESCPVCGSTSHPFLSPGFDLSAFATNLKSQHSELESHLHHLNSQQISALSQQAQATQATAHCATIAAEYSKLLIHLPPTAPSTADPAPLQSLRDTLNGSLTHIDQQLTRAASLDIERQDLQQHLHLIQQRTNNANQLAPLLAPFEITIEALDAAPKPSARQFLRLANQFLQDQNQASLANEQIQQISLTLSTANAELNAAHSNLASATTTNATAHQLLEDLNAQRRPLLEGQPLAQHRNSLLAHQHESNQQHLAASTSLAFATSALEAATKLQQSTAQDLAENTETRREAEAAYTIAAQSINIDPKQALDLLNTSAATRSEIERTINLLEQALHTTLYSLNEATNQLTTATEVCANMPTLQQVEASRLQATDGQTESNQAIGNLNAELSQDKSHRQQFDELQDQLNEATQTWEHWSKVNSAIGSADGKKFRNFVQGITLDHLIHLANHHLASFDTRYQLQRSEASDLALQVIDSEMTNASRAVSTLSGGERFLISLGLALALSSLEGKESFVDSLFIDEGFGSLDTESLDLVMAALEALPSSGRRVGVITHVDAMKDRIATQVRITKNGQGHSAVSIVDSQTDNFVLYASSGNNES